MMDTTRNRYPADCCLTCRAYRSNFASPKDGLVTLPAPWFDASESDNRLGTGECHFGPPTLGGFFRSTPMFPGVYERDWCACHSTVKVTEEGLA